jgi:Flp pilus assembly pilin Flp
MRSVVRFIQAEDAATAVEYSVMLALVLMAAFAAITTFGGRTASLWGAVANSVAAVTP